MPRIDKQFSLKLLPWIIPGGMALFVLFIIHTFFFNLIHIPSMDMNPNYKQGDLSLLRITNTFKHGDVLAFNFFDDDSVDTKPLLFTQRCIGLPGDTIEISNGIVYVNSNEETYKYELNYNFHVKAKVKLDSVFLIKYNLWEGGSVSDENDYSFSMTYNTANELKKDSFILTVTKNIEKSDFRDEQLYTDDSIHKWNKHNFGKVYLPKKNDILTLDTSTIFIYKKLVEKENKQHITIHGDSIFMDNIPVKQVAIKENYYFVLGDNRDNAIDSRYWGLLAEKNITGKIIKVIYSKK